VGAVQRDAVRHQQLLLLPLKSKVDMRPGRVVYQQKVYPGGVRRFDGFE
jgi:hypothetical protein